MKKYIATWMTGTQIHEVEIFIAVNIKHAKKFAQFYKRMNGLKGITLVTPAK